MEIKMNKLLFAKVKPDAIIPTKRDEDMGFDIYACFDDEFMTIQPHETKLVPTGIASACSQEYGILLRERGSTGSKGIALRAGVIDSGYRGEWFVGLTNTTSNILFISKLSKEETFAKYFDKIEGCELKAFVYPYSKAIAQALVVEVPKMHVEEVSYEDLNTIKSDRGSTKLGASGK